MAVYAWPTVALAEAPVLICTTSAELRSVMLSEPEATTKVLAPPPPESVSFPWPPESVSLPVPPTSVSFQRDPVSVVALPVLVRVKP